MLRNFLEKYTLDEYVVYDVHKDIEDLCTYIINTVNYKLAEIRTQLIEKQKLYVGVVPSIHAPEDSRTPELLGVEFKCNTNRKMVIKGVMFHPVGVKKAFDTCGLKVELFICGNYTMKQLTLVETGDYSDILHRAKQKYTSFLDENISILIPKENS